MSSQTQRGQALAQLLLDSQSWVHRRVESLRLNASGTTTRTVSLDFTLPEESKIAGSKDRVLLPLGVVVKGALKRLSTLGQHGPLPVLETEENSALALEMLEAITSNALPDSVASAPELRTLLRAVVEAQPDEAAARVSALQAWLGSQGFKDDEPAVDVAIAMARTFGTNFLLIVEMDAELVGTRAIVKYSHEDSVAKTATTHIPSNVGWEVPHFGMAASWHMEVGTLPGVRITTLLVQERDADGTPILEWEDPEAHAKDGATVAHVACKPTHRLTTANVVVSLTPTVGGPVQASLWGSTLVLAAIALYSAHHAFPGLIFEGGRDASSSTVSLLLAGPALLLSWLAKSPEHVLVARVLAPPRRALATSAMTLFGLACLIALPFSGELRCISLALVAAVQAWVTFQAWRVRAAVGRTA